MNGAMADWASQLTNDAHVSVAFLPDATLTTGTTYYSAQVDYLPFGDYKAALGAHAGFALDATAVTYLQATTTDRFGYLINGSNQEEGATHPASSDTLEVNAALEKAPGIAPTHAATDFDFTVYYNPDASRYDYDRSDGISAGLLDFGGAMRTQIGQGLGFSAELDLVDDQFGQGYDDADAEGIQMPLDLFRFQDSNGTSTRLDRRDRGEVPHRRRRYDEAGRLPHRDRARRRLHDGQPHRDERRVQPPACRWDPIRHQCPRPPGDERRRLES